MQTKAEAKIIVFFCKLDNRQTGYVYQQKNG